MKNYWISWYHEENFKPFELNTPWWQSGWRVHDDAGTICAAVKAESEEGAKEIIYVSYDERPIEIEFRFCEERPKDFSPFSERFEKEDWMVWTNEIDSEETK
jgi:hypothetical protein